jgi:hypothetical protein
MTQRWARAAMGGRDPVRGRKGKTGVLGLDSLFVPFAPAHFSDPGQRNLTFFPRKFRLKFI